MIKLNGDYFLIKSKLIVTNHVQNMHILVKSVWMHFCLGIVMV